MIKWITSGVLSMVFSLFIFSAQASSNPTEQKIDKIMGTYASKMKAAFLEKDDQKTLTLLQAASHEAAAEMKKIMPELEKWSKEIEALQGAEKEAFEKRFQAKPYFKAMFEIMFDPAVAKRLQANPALSKALEESSSALQKFRSTKPNEEEAAAEEE